MRQNNTTFNSHMADTVQDKKTHLLPFAEILLLAAMTYNAFAAIVNAHLISLSATHIMLVEVAIILAAALFICSNINDIARISPHITFLFITLAFFFWVSLFNDTLYVKSLRDMLLLPLFMMIGAVLSQKGLFRTFRCITIVIFFFMVQEAWFTELYVKLFEPASYFANTRGIEQLSVDSTGLFRNSLGFKGRFSYGIFETHRLSSIFLEQVSLANFSMVLGLFASAFWPKLKPFDRILYVTTIIFILLTNNSRTASIVNALILMSYFIFPKLPKYSNLVYIPAILLFSALFIYDPSLNPYNLNDDFQGRIERTLHSLSNLDISSLFIGNIQIATLAADSGYVYLICTQTILGLICFWLFTCVILPADNNVNKRVLHGIGLYIAINLMIGAAIFTIKVSAPLWVIVGYLYQHTNLPSISPPHRA